MPRSTVSNVIERVRRQLASSLRNEVNVLGASINATDTTVTMSYELQTSLGPGAVLSVGSELMRVISVNTAAKECVVLRGWQDSEGEAHALGDEVLINPRFTRFDIFDALLDEIDSWSPNLFYVESYQWDVLDTEETVELPALLADSLGVIRLNRQWTDSDSTGWPSIDFRLLRGTVGTWDQATTSGLVIRMIPNHSTMRNGKVHALIARPFDVNTTAPTEASDLVADYNLTSSMMDLLQLGIKTRLMTDDENGRSARMVQDEPRRTEEVPAGSSLTVGQTLRANYRARMGDEMRKLQEKYPLRSW